MNLKENKYTKHRIGQDTQHVLIDAPHATHPRGESPTGEIADQVSLEIGCHCIIGTVSRTKADLNRAPEESGNPKAIYEYRDVIKQILNSADLIKEDNSLTQPFLHLQIHGMKDRSLDSSLSYDLDVEIGTINKTTCSTAVHDWIVEKFNDWSNTVDGKKEIKIGANERFSGDQSKAYHREGYNDDYPGYGANFHTIQIEFANWLRSSHQSDIEKILVLIAEEFENADSEKWNAA